MESLREKTGRRVVFGVLGLLLTVTTAAGCGIESDAATREIGECGSTAAYGDGYDAGAPIDDVQSTATSVKEDLEYLEEFIADSGDDTFRLDEPESDMPDSNVDYIELRVHEDDLVLATDSIAPGSQPDLLRFSRNEDGTLKDISYGTVVCTQGMTVIPTRTVEFIEGLASVAHSIDGQPS